MTVSTKTLRLQYLKEYENAKTDEERKAISRKLYHDVICPEADAEYLQFKALGLSDEDIYTHATKFVIMRMTKIIADNG